MAVIGHLKDGKFVKDLGNFNIAETPEATESTSGLMSATDKTKLDNAYTSADVVSVETINKLFKEED